MQRVKHPCLYIQQDYRSKFLSKFSSTYIFFCTEATKALARLHICAGSPKPLLLDHVRSIKISYAD